MKKTQLKNSLLLLLTATIWGVAFVAQSVGMDHVGPFTFNAVRSIIGGIVLIPCIFFLDHRKSDQKEELPSPQQQAEQTSTLILGGVCCGILLALASSFSRLASSIQRSDVQDLSLPAILLSFRFLAISF